MNIYIKILTLVIPMAFVYMNAKAETQKNDTIRDYIPFLQIKSAGGTVFPTTPIVQGQKAVTWFNAASFRFGYAATGNRWQDRVYKMPFMGVGFHITNFYRNSDIGRPMALYLFYGARWKTFSPRLSLGYEINLGYSMDWKPYNSVYNPQNGAIGAKWAMYVAFEPHIIWRINPYFDLQAGIMLSHYSNGGTHKPNNGLNMISPAIALRYKFQRSDFNLSTSYDVPTFKKYIGQDVSMNFAVRQLMTESLTNKDEKVPVDYNFKVVGLNYNCYYAPSYNYKYGISLHFVYDSSSNAQIEINNNTSIVKHDLFKHRFSLGIAAYGELCTEYFSMFANIGYNVVHNQKRDSRIYQILGVKFYLSDNLFGTIGVNANGFSSARYLYLSLGYTFR